MSFQPGWRIRRFLNLDPVPQPKSAPTALPIPKMPATMKKPPIASPIKTYGVERDPTIFGALPLTREHIQESMQRSKIEREEREKELRVPIQTFNNTPGTGFSAQMGGLSLTDPKIIRDSLAWEQAQKALLIDRTIVPDTRGPAPGIKTYHN